MTGHSLKQLVAPPNPRVQRTRVARCARPGSPLTRHPLGGRKALIVGATAIVIALVGAVKTSEVKWTKPGEIKIVVVDRDSEPVPGATVVLSDSASAHQRSVITDANGRAAFSGVSRGDYLVKVDLSGFATYTIGPFRMRADSSENPELPEFVVMLNPLRVS